MIGKAIDGFSFSDSGTLNDDGSYSGSCQTVYMGLDVTVTYSGKFEGDNFSGDWGTSWTGGANSGAATGSKTF